MNLTEQEKQDCNKDFDVRDMRASYVPSEYESEELSECCGAPILMETFCKSCMEHCK